jgi:3-phenylpropionate/trans-cinnamate dioxygenase ferredoxin reductase subunit
MSCDLKNGRIVIVGASLAGLRAAETLREKGFAGELTMVGEERQYPYDRPPLSKQVLLGRVRAMDTELPQCRELHAKWRLGIRATRLDPIGKCVLLADGEELPFDRLLIATGTRARPWRNAEEAALDGVFTLHTSEDALPRVNLKRPDFTHGNSSCAPSDEGAHPRLAAVAFDL